MDKQEQWKGLLCWQNKNLSSAEIAAIYCVAGGPSS